MAGIWHAKRFSRWPFDQSCCPLSETEPCRTATPEGWMWPAWSWCWHWEQGAWAVLLCFSMILLCLTLFSCAVLSLIKSGHLETDTNSHLSALVIFFFNTLTNAGVLFAIKS